MHTRPTLETATDPLAWKHRMDQWIQAGTAPSTRRAYVRDLRYFWAWHQLALGQSEQYPVSEESVVRFILDHLDPLPPAISQPLIHQGRRKDNRPLKIITLRRYLGSLSVAHQERGLISPTQSETVKLLLKRARRAKAGQPSVKKAAITKDILAAMLATCDDSLRGVRDRAILLVGFASGGRRRSELAALFLENLEPIDSGYLLHIERSKTDQDGEGFTVPVLGPAAQALKAWLLRSGLRSGPLFRGIRNNEALNDDIKGQTINDIVKRRVALAGLDAKHFGAHSLRAGFITEAARSGNPLGDAMALSGHKSNKIAGGYYRKAELLANRASQLLNSN